MHGRPLISEEEWTNSQEFSAREASGLGENFVPENYVKCVGRALRLVPIYLPKTCLLAEVEGYENGPF